MNALCWSAADHPASVRYRTEAAAREVKDAYGCPFTVLGELTRPGLERPPAFRAFFIGPAGGAVFTLPDPLPFLPSARTAVPARSRPRRSFFSVPCFSVPWFIPHWVRPIRSCSPTRQKKSSRKTAHASSCTIRPELSALPWRDVRIADAGIIACNASRHGCLPSNAIRTLFPFSPRTGDRHSTGRMRRLFTSGFLTIRAAPVINT